MVFKMFPLIYLYMFSNFYKVIPVHPVHLFLFLFSESSVWVWLKGSGGEGPGQVGDVEPVSAALWDSESQGGCIQMALGTLGQWRKARCAGRYHSLCAKEVTGKT